MWNIVSGIPTPLVGLENGSFSALFMKFGTIAVNVYSHRYVIYMVPGQLSLSPNSASMLGGTSVNVSGR